MKLVIDKPIILEISNAKDQLDIADYFESVNIKFYHHLGWFLVIEAQEVSLSSTEDLFDRLTICGMNISLERAERGIYFLRTY